jgi:cytochrome bd-type quinol oxidase subunit 2
LNNGNGNIKPDEASKMRWRLLVLVSFIAALIAFGLWEVTIVLMFGSVRPAQANQQLLAASIVVPLFCAAAATFFVYRHTSRRRKTQATLSFMLTLLLAGGAYLAGASLFPRQLAVPQPCQHPPCR